MKYIQTWIGYRIINGQDFYLGIERRGVPSLGETKWSNSKKKQGGGLMLCKTQSIQEILRLIVYSNI